MPQSDEERLLVSLEARISDFEKKMAKAERRGTKTYQGLQRGSSRATRQMERDMTRSTTRINQALATTSRQFGLMAKTFAAGIAGGGLAGFTRQVRSVVAEVSELGKVANKVGVNAEELQRLQFGFELTGVAANTTNMALQRFSRRVAEAASGSGELLPILKANNIALRDADGRMRSQTDILRDYADLIKNAGSSQERLLLAFKAFDSEGAAFVVGLQNGANGLDTLMRKADEAGGVIDNELVKRAEELDDEFAIAWRNFELNAKRAILSVMPLLGRLDDAAKSFLSNLPVARLGQYLFGEEEDPISQRINDAFSGDLPAGNARLERELQKRYGKSGRKTVIPNSGDGKSRDAAAQAALREQEAINKLIGSLNHELSLIGASDLEKAKANALRQAGSAATDDQRAQIERLVTMIHEETEALERNREAQEARQDAIENLFSMGETALMSIVDGSMEAEEAIKRLAVQLALAAAQAALLGTGPLAGIFGGGFGIGSAISPLASSAIAGGAFGLFANGTADTGGRRGEPRGIVHGQEAVIPLPDGRKVPVQMTGDGGGGDVTYAPTYNIDARDANDPESVKRTVSEALREHDKSSFQRFMRDHQRAKKAVHNFR